MKNWTPVCYLLSTSNKCLDFETQKVSNKKNATPFQTKSYTHAIKLMLTFGGTIKRVYSDLIISNDNWQYSAEFIFYTYHGFLQKICEWQWEHTSCQRATAPSIKHNM